jgi:AcrR family transcriptional regulator
MPDTHENQGPGANRKRGTRSTTRERLIAATLKLLHQGGETAVTTVSVTRTAGIVQSAFYRHFANLEECLAAAAERATADIRATVAEARRRMFEESPGTGEDLEHSLRKMFRLARRQRPVTELYLRFRSDRVSLNGVMYRYARGLVRDLAEQLTGRAAKVGLSDTGPERMEPVADYVVGACSSAIEAFLDGRSPSVNESSRLLASFLTGGCLGAYETLRSTK